MDAAGYKETPTRHILKRYLNPDCPPAVSSLLGVMLAKPEIVGAIEPRQGGPQQRCSQARLDTHAPSPYESYGVMIVGHRHVEGGHESVDMCWNA